MKLKTFYSPSCYINCCFLKLNNNKIKIIVIVNDGNLKIVVRFLYLKRDSLSYNCEVPVK